MCYNYIIKENIDDDVVVDILFAIKSKNQIITNKGIMNKLPLLWNLLHVRF